MRWPAVLHPFHAAALAGTLPPFLGSLLADYAYWSSHEIQWSDFASWLIVGGLAFGAVALVCALAGLFGAPARSKPSGLYLLVLAAMWLLGLCNALVHSRDAWAIMPTALALSAVVAVLSFAATWIGLSTRRGGGA
jgi:uncharacterized membrane protein